MYRCPCQLLSPSPLPLLLPLLLSCTTKEGDEGGEVAVAVVIAAAVIAVVDVAVAALVALVVVSRSRATMEVVAALGRRGASEHRGQKRGVPEPPNRASLLLSLSRRRRFCCHGRPPRCRGWPVPRRHGSHPCFRAPWTDKRSPSTAQLCH